MLKLDAVRLYMMTWRRLRICGGFFFIIWIGPYVWGVFIIVCTRSQSNPMSRLRLLAEKWQARCMNSPGYTFRFGLSTKRHL